MNQDYSGLNTTSLPQRVKRYAQDVRKKFSNTDVNIVNVESSKNPIEGLHYRSIDEFKSDLELIRNSLVATNLSCEHLDTLLTQVNIMKQFVVEWEPVH